MIFRTLLLCWHKPFGFHQRSDHIFTHQYGYAPLRPPITCDLLPKGMVVELST